MKRYRVRGVMPSRWAASAVLSQVISVVPIKLGAYRVSSAAFDTFGGPSPAFTPSARRGLCRRAERSRHTMRRSTALGEDCGADFGAVCALRGPDRRL